jgi:hypothetical protein
MRIPGSGPPPVRPDEVIPRDFAAHPQAPPSEVEWEDLLLRMEMAQRALRLAVEDAGGRDPALAAELHAAALAEAWLGYALDRIRQGEPFVRGGNFALEMPEAETEEETYLRAATSRRARNFAMLQRRGIDVWAWAAEVRGHGRVTVYQLISATVRADAERLARIRSLRSG